MYRFAFVLEQTMGHVAHAHNLRRALQSEPDIEATVIPIEYNEPAGMQRLPGLRTWSWRASAAASDALRKRVAEGRLDGIFIHTQVAALRATDIMRTIPTIVSLDATPLQFDREGDAYGHRRGPVPVEAVKKSMNGRSFKSAAKLVTWCRWAAYSLVADYGVAAENIDVIPPGVDLSLFRPLLVPKRSDAVRVLFVGADFERKGGPDLLDAARRLGDEVELDIVTTETVAIPAGPRIRVHRNLQPHSDELVNLYRQAHVFALPSRGDCMPQAVAEALACGVPVVASHVGAIPEMITDHVNGLLVPARDPAALAAAIHSLAKSRSQRSAMGHRARSTAEQHFDAGYNNGRIFDLMRRLASEGERAAQPRVRMPEGLPA